MDPEAGLEGLLDSSRSVTILDPMMGSGTIPVLAALRGHRGVGFDVDPLAYLIAQALASSLDSETFTAAASGVVKDARTTSFCPDWDDETQAFVDYWFDSATQKHLGSLADVISKTDGALRPALWCAFSRLIITKDAGASRARDVSHSRPHRVRDRASFNVFDRFESSAHEVLRRHQESRVGASGDGVVVVRRGDARRLPLGDDSIDAIATSPPYLQAIDYMRGHRLSLVWMGHRLSELREIRSTSIGTERSLQLSEEAQVGERIVDAGFGTLVRERVEDRSRAVVRRYVRDLNEAIAEFSRVLKPSGLMRFVVADATVRGQPVSVSRIVQGLCKRHDFSLVKRRVRELPRNRRYLPPPDGSDGALGKRIKKEYVLTFALAG